jgi:hypothetical protein
MADIAVPGAGAGSAGATKEAELGRDRLVKIETTYQGHHDALMVSVEPDPSKMGPTEAPTSVPQSEGIPDAIVKLTPEVPFNDLDALRAMFASHPEQIAAVIVEPAMMNCGIILPDTGYLAGIKEIAYEHGAVLICDEVKTGVTIGPGGATERFDVTPDLVCLSQGHRRWIALRRRRRAGRIMALIDEAASHRGAPADHGGIEGHPLIDILTPSAYAHFDAMAEVLQGRTGLGHPRPRAALPRHQYVRPRRRDLPVPTRPQLSRLPGDRQGARLPRLALPIQPRRVDGARRRGELDDLGPAQRD